MKSWLYYGGISQDVMDNNGSRRWLVWWWRPVTPVVARRYPLDAGWRRWEVVAGPPHHCRLIPE
eukprot:2125198-Heterocapsa_arctica.AAC.1